MTTETTLKHLLFLCVALFLLTQSLSALAACNIVASSPKIGPVDSFTLNSTPLGVLAGAGFYCSPEVASLNSTNTLTATLSSTNQSNKIPLLLNGAGDAVPYSICVDSSCSPAYQDGGVISWSRTTLLDLLGLFNTSDGTMPLYFRTTPGANIPAGTYTDTLKITWVYRFCYVGLDLLGIKICIPNNGTLVSTVNVSLQVTNFCYIDSAPEVIFTSAALPSSFSDYSGQLAIRCTKNAAYTVNLTSITNTSVGDWRRMSLPQQTAWLQYQFYQANGSAWTESNNLSVTGSGTPQSASYTVKINPAQSNQPAGTYSDTILVTVTY